MRIDTITIENFRCFGPTTQEIRLNDQTALVGSNATGKTAMLNALQRLFGQASSDREIRPEDFHCPRIIDDAEEVLNRNLSIEVKLIFPELETDADADGEDGTAVAECFRQMVVTQNGETPFCIIRLEAEWEATGAPEGVVEQRTFWVRPDKEVPMRAADRALIRLHYVPAVRDPLKQIRHASGSIMTRLFKAVNWSDGVIDSVTKSADEIQVAFSAEDGVTTIQSKLSENWKALHGAGMYSGVKIRPISGRFEDLLRQVEAVFSPSPGGKDDPLDRLSDGQRSLLYLAMVGTAFDAESVVLASQDGSEGLDLNLLSPPSLTIFAVEEPENHIAPHLLGGIMKVLKTLSGSDRAQVILTSHSPSILHRVEPEEVRHLRLDTNDHSTLVRSIKLPEAEHDAHKFIREAVRAYPELYFARFVVLGEGASEEVILPKFAEAFECPIDQSFVSIVPLGGRHVNHMWRLLEALEIPYLTLLDLDRDRKGGGWGRVKYTLDQLIENEVSKSELLAMDEDGREWVMSDEEFSKMPTWDDEYDLDNWVDSLEEYGVYFCSPLDLDFTMLKHFREEYLATADEKIGPNIPKNTDDDCDIENEKVVSAVLKKSGGDGSTYSEEEIVDFYWYRYLFLGRGKPTTHMRAMTGLSPEELTTKCPPVIRSLIAKMKEEIQGGSDAV